MTKEVCLQLLALFSITVNKSWKLSILFVIKGTKHTDGSAEVNVVFKFMKERSVYYLSRSLVTVLVLYYNSVVLVPHI